MRFRVRFVFFEDLAVEDVRDVSRAEAVLRHVRVERLHLRAE